MLNVSREAVLSAAELPDRDRLDHGRLMGPATIFTAVWRRKAASISLILGFVSLGAIFALTSAPLFTATSEILIDGRRSHTDDGSVSNRSLAELGMDSASIESQLAVLGSEKNVLDTIKALRLENDAEFTAPTTIIGVALLKVKQLLGRDKAGQITDGVRSDVLEEFTKRLDVKRIQQSYVLSLSFSATNPQRAAAIANTMADNYVNAQVSGVLESRASSAAWLKDRLASLRSEIAAAEQSLRSGREEMANETAKPSNGWTGSTLPNGRDRVRDLERALDAKRALYTALFDRSRAMLQQQSLPVSDASILRAARPPERASQPKFLLIIVLGLIAGVASAVGWGVLRETMDVTFRTPSQLRDELGLRLLASMPRLKKFYKLEENPEGILDRAATQAWSIVAAVEYVSHGALRVVGVTSSIEGEDSAFVARSLASRAAAEGLRTLLICGNASAGVSGSRAIRYDETLGLDTIAVGRPATNGRGAPMDRRKIEEIETEVGGRYDLMVLNLPPLCVLRDSSVATSIDALVLAVAWGRTERAVVAEALHAAPTLAHRVIGAVFTGADDKNLRQYSRRPVDRFHIESAHHANV